MSKLRPCPFCGGKAIVKKTPYSHFARVYTYITCDNCCAKSGYYTKESIATEAWNCRAGEYNV